MSNINKTWMYTEFINLILSMNWRKSVDRVGRDAKTIVCVQTLYDRTMSADRVQFQPAIHYFEGQEMYTQIRRTMLNAYDYLSVRNLDEKLK